MISHASSSACRSINHSCHYMPAFNPSLDRIIIRLSSTAAQTTSPKLTDLDKYQCITQYSPIFDDPSTLHEAQMILSTFAHCHCYSGEVVGRKAEPNIQSQIHQVETETS